MTRKHLITLCLTAMLLLCVMISTALACDCGEKHKKVYPLNAESNPKYILTVQKQLDILGYSYKAAPGVYNSSMKNAIKKFQYDSNLPRNKKLTTCTLYRLDARSSAVKANSKLKHWTNIFNGDYTLMQKGNHGARVRKLNYYLHALGYGTTPSSSTYSAATALAVRQFQAKYVRNHPVDGKAGPYTLSALEKNVYRAK